jgi:glutaminase
MTLAQPAAAAPSAETSATDASYRSLSDSFAPDSGDRISPLQVLARLKRCGLRPDDPRIADALAGLTGRGQPGRAGFRGVHRRHRADVPRAAAGHLWPGGRLYPAAGAGRPGPAGDRGVHRGRQRFAVGDATTAFCLQSVSETVSYCLALDEHGTEAVHRHVGRELSGWSFMNNTDIATATVVAVLLAGPGA